MAKGEKDLRCWYGRGGHWTLAAEYGKFCTISPTAHLTNSPWWSTKSFVISFLLPEKKKERKKKPL